jgi:hypothetical protein
LSITDRRDISFDADAILAAIAALPDAAGVLGLPAAPPDALRFEPAEHRILVQYRVSVENAEFSVPMESLGAMLVGFCCRHRITLPRGARKSIRIEEEAAVLSFVLHLPVSRVRSRQLGHAKGVAAPSP